MEIRAAHRRLHHELSSHGIRAGICRIRRIRRKVGIRCKQKRRFRTTTDSKHNLPVAQNLLDRQFRVYQPNAAWVSDITYVPTDEGWLYLAGHKDLFTGEIVGYAMGERLTKTLTTQSLLRAPEAKRPPLGLIHHSDRGSQYCSHEYRSLVEHFGLKASMSGTGNCYDNAPMESFWGTLKQELVHHRRYASRREAVQDITEYIEVFYNRQRLQARLCPLLTSHLTPLGVAISNTRKPGWCVRCSSTLLHLPTTLAQADRGLSHQSSPASK